MPILFDDKKNISAYRKLIQHYERVTCKTRVTHAEATLQKLKQSIDTRVEKLQQIAIFLTQEHALYEHLTQEYQITPTPALTLHIEKLKQAIDQFEAKLAQTHPEEVIADLRAKHDTLKTLLSVDRTKAQSTQT